MLVYPGPLGIPSRLPAGSLPAILAILFGTRCAHPD
jgi:hypothetical protein